MNTADLNTAMAPPSENENQNMESNNNMDKWSSTLSYPKHDHTAQSLFLSRYPKILQKTKLQKNVKKQLI